MEYEDMSDDLLYRELKSRIPGLSMYGVDFFSRNTTIAMLKITEEISEPRDLGSKREVSWEASMHEGDNDPLLLQRSTCEP